MTTASLSRLKGPSALVVAAAVVLPLAFGARLADVLLGFGYELVYVLAPGWLAFRALSDRPGRPLRQLAFGWALGYVLEILAFIATAAIDERGLLVAYPVAMAAVTLPVIAHRRRTELEGEARAQAHVDVPSGWAWAVAVIAALTLVYASIADYTLAPLPSPDRTVLYHPDQVFHLSIAAEAKHHWPIRDSRVSGEPHAYHVFGHIHVAAVSQVTGVDLPAVYLRLYLVPLLILLALQFAYAGRALTGNAWVGVAAAGLMLLVGELDVDPRQALPNGAFYGYFFNSLYQSPSFVLGLAFFIPTVLLLNDLLNGDRVAGRWREWLLLVLFLVGCAGAKVTLPPLLLGGLGLFALWRLWTSRRLGAAVPAAIGAVLLVMGGFYLAQYRGHSSGTSIDPFGSTDSMLGVQLVKAWLAGAPGPLGSHLVLDVVGTVVGLIALLVAPLIGLPFLLRSRGWRLEARHAWLLALFVSGLGGFLVIDPNGQFFLFYGYAAAGLLSAEGLVTLISRDWNRDLPPARSAAVALIWLAFLAFLIVLPLELWDPTSTKANGALYFGWYVTIALAVLVIYLAARRRPLAALGAPALVAAALVIVGALDTPLDNGPRWLKGERPLYEAFLGRGMSGGLYEGLTWVRGHTGSGEVLAVNRGQADNPDAPSSSRYFYYSAFSERRVFLEDWSFATKAYDVGVKDPFPERVRLNYAVFAKADPRAIRTLAHDYGVTHLVVDRRMEGVSPLLARRARLVFLNRAVAVYSLRDPR